MKKADIQLFTLQYDIQIFKSSQDSFNIDNKIVSKEQQTGPLLEALLRPLRKKELYTERLTPSYMPYRYVTYPLSQALLNREDLKAINTLFRYTFKEKGEDLPYEDFLRLFTPLEYYSSYFTARCRKLCEKPPSPDKSSGNSTRISSIGTAATN